MTINVAELERRALELIKQADFARRRSRQRTNSSNAIRPRNRRGRGSGAATSNSAISTRPSRCSAPPSRCETGEIGPRPRRYGPPRKLAPHLHTLAALIAEQPDRTLAEWQQALGIPVSMPTVCRAVQQLGLPVKKTRTAQRARPT